jgi:hypothetical protein
MSRSMRMDYERYRNPIILYPCYECATLTPSLPDMSGVSLCDAHRAPVPMYQAQCTDECLTTWCGYKVGHPEPCNDIRQNELLFCQEVHSEFRTIA